MAANPEAKGAEVEMAKTVTITTEALSLQARVEQCEAAIEAAHSILSKIEPLDDASDKSPEPNGAMAVIDRCNHLMSELNDRLTAVADKVGRL